MTQAQVVPHVPPAVPRRDVPASNIRVPAAGAGAVHEPIAMQISPAMQPAAQQLAVPAMNLSRKRATSADGSGLKGKRARARSTGRSMQRLRANPEYVKGERARQRVSRAIKSAASRGTTLTRADAIAADMRAHGDTKGLTLACYESGYGKGQNAM